MPNASEMARVEEEALPEINDDAIVLDGLQTRAHRLGFSSVTAALDFVEKIGGKDYE